VSILINLPPEVEAQLREKAVREGKEAEVIASDAVARMLAWEAQERAEVIASVRRSDAAAAEGRVRPLEEFVNEQRAKHGLPASWPHED
jgi:predicted transcriptional regulator